MSIFSNPFFSLAGQKERLTNVVATLKAAVTGQGVKSNTGSQIADKILGTAASHPFITAGVGAVAVAPAAAGAAAKAGIQSLAKSYAASSLTTKVVVAAAVPIVGSAVLQSPKLQKGLINAPSSLANFGTNVGEFAENPSIEKAKDVFKENPIIAGGIAAAAAATIGGGIGLAANTLATFSNTRATKANTSESSSPLNESPKLASDAPLSLPNQPESEMSRSASLTPTPADAPTASLVTTKTKAVTRYRKKKRVPKVVYRTRSAPKTQVLNILSNRMGVYG